VADENKDAFRRFHAALFAQQPAETATSYPDNAHLIEIARQAGVSGTVPDCINSGKYVKMVQGMAEAAKINATPTIRINGEDYKYSTPQALVDKVKSIVGNVPGLDQPAPANPKPTPAPAP
jgi:protein-disulfide isomerase